MLDFQRARAFHGGLCQKKNCPILILCEALALVCLPRDVSYCSLSASALKTVQLIFRSLQIFCQSIFVKLCTKREDTFQKVAPQGYGFVTIFFFFSSTGMDASGSFAVITPNIWPVITCIVPQYIIDLGWSNLSSNNSHQASKGCCALCFDPSSSLLITFGHPNHLNQYLLYRST